MITQKLNINLLIITAFFSCLFGVERMAAQQHENNEPDQGTHLKEPGFEIVNSLTVIVNPEEDVSDLANEVHLTYWFSHKWALGVGYTLIFEEHSRIGHELAALASHKPWSFLTINGGPSFTLPNSEVDFEVSAYLEGEINIWIGNKGFHFGPVKGMLAGEHFRYFGGIHIGYEF